MSRDLSVLSPVSVCDIEDCLDVLDTRPDGVVYSEESLAKMVDSATILLNNLLDIAFRQGLAAGIGRVGTPVVGEPVLDVYLSETFGGDPIKF